MNFPKINIPVSWGVIVVLIVIIVLQRECTRAPKCPEPTIIERKVLIPGDKELIKIPVKVPVPYFVDRCSLIVDIKNVDTAAILKDYFARYFYCDTIRDTSFVAVIKEIISRNKIVNRELYVQNLREKVVQQIITNYELRNTNKIYIGGSVGASPQSTDHSPQINVSALWQTKKDHIYYYSYGVLDKSHNLGTYWKVSLRKK